MDGASPELPNLKKGPDYSAQIEFGGLMLGFLQIAVQQMLQQYAPELAASLTGTTALFTWPIFIMSSGLGLESYFAKIQNAGYLKSRYVIDAKRRTYLHSIGKSAFTGLLVQS